MGQADRLHRRGVALIAGSALVWSVAGLFMRALPLDLWVVQFWRASFGAAALYLFIAAQRGGGVLAALRPSRGGALATVVSAGAMITYIAALHLTTVAEVMIVAATMPLAAALLGWAIIGERPTRRALATSLLALAGIAVMTGGAANVSSLTGDALAGVMTLLFALLIVLARRDHSIDMTAANAHAALLVALIAAPLAGGALLDVTPRDLGLLAAFGASQTALAFALFLYGARFAPPAEAALILLLDNALSPVWVWLVFSERPGAAALIGGALVFAAVLAHLVADLTRASAKDPA